MKDVGSMYMLMLPIIIAGALNMWLCKSHFFLSFNKPMDLGINFIDGYRIFGNNKTFRGFFGMIIFTTISQLMWAYILNFFKLTIYHPYYLYYENNLTNNFKLGFMLGLAYVVFELPNSFLKRRFKIPPGQLAHQSIKRIFFYILDQVDSLIGCVIVLQLFFPLRFNEKIIIMGIGALTHIIVNQLLYLLKLRNNPN